MSQRIMEGFLIAWLLVFIPVGLLGFGLWALWRLIPRFRMRWGYSKPISRLDKHPCSK